MYLHGLHVVLGPLGLEELFLEALQPLTLLLQLPRHHPLHPVGQLADLEGRPKKKERKKKGHRQIYVPNLCMHALTQI